MTMPNDQDSGLDDLFATARSLRAEPSEALMARVLADAVAEQPRAVAALVVRPVRRPGILAQVAGVFGGFGALAGMGTAAVAGVLIGYAQPEGLLSVSEVVFGAPLETVELIPSVETLFSGK